MQSVALDALVGLHVGSTHVARGLRHIHLKVNVHPAVHKG